jgi:hypothetical protein
MGCTERNDEDERDITWVDGKRVELTAEMTEEARGTGKAAAGSAGDLSSAAAAT